MVLTVIELRIREKPHEVRAIAWLDMVPLEVERNIAERFWVSIDIEGSNCGRRLLACFFSFG